MPKENKISEGMLEEILIKEVAMQFGEEQERDGQKVMNCDCITAMNVIFLAMKELEKKGIELKIPYYWSTDGVRLELNTLVDRFPGITWTCSKEEYMRCPYQVDCDYRGKYRGD